MHSPLAKSRSPIRCILSRAGGLAAVALCLAPLSVRGATIINNVEFDVVYAGYGLPEDATPEWDTRLGIDSAQSVDPESGIYTLSTTTSGTGSLRIENSPLWDAGTGVGTPGTTIEFSMKVDEQVATGASNAALQLLFSNGSRRYEVRIADGMIFAGTSSSSYSYSLDTSSDFNTYRITLSGDGEGLVSIYVNNSTTAVISGYAGVTASTDAIIWGDTSTVIGGTTTWEYFAYTNSGAFAPIPEAHTLALCGTGMALLLLMGRRSRGAGASR